MTLDAQLTDRPNVSITETVMATTMAISAAIRCARIISATLKSSTPTSPAQTMLTVMLIIRTRPAATRFARQKSSAQII